LLTVEIAPRANELPRSFQTVVVRDVQTVVVDVATAPTQRCDDGLAARTRSDHDVVHEREPEGRGRPGVEHPRPRDGGSPHRRTPVDPRRRRGVHVPLTVELEGTDQGLVELILSDQLPRVAVVARAEDSHPSIAPRVVPLGSFTGRIPDVTIGRVDR